MENTRRYAAEFVGTLLLVFVGVGSAIAARVGGGVVVVALAFGLTLIGLVYIFGPISGCHVNPAVTLGVLASGKISVPAAVGYWIAQFAGAIVASFFLYVFVEWGNVADQTGALGTSGYGVEINLGGTILLETVLTFLLVLVFLVVTSRTQQAGATGLSIGSALAACMLLAVGLDGGSVNPARSLGPAVFQGDTALTQLWVFIIFPSLGGLLAALVAGLILNQGAPLGAPEGS
jgi:aquaporin Z